MFEAEIMCIYDECFIHARQRGDAIEDASAAIVDDDDAKRRVELRHHPRRVRVVDRGEVADDADVLAPALALAEEGGGEIVASQSGGSGGGDVRSEAGTPSSAAIEPAARGVGSFMRGPVNPRRKRQRDPGTTRRHLDARECRLSRHAARGGGTGQGVRKSTS